MSQNQLDYYIRCYNEAKAIENQTAMSIIVDWAENMLTVEELVKFYEAMIAE